MITDGVSGHEDGHVSVTYDSTGQHIITGGTDGDVRIYKSVDDKVRVCHELIIEWLILVWVAVMSSHP